MKRLLCGVCLPRWPLLNRHIRIARHEALLSAHDRPLNLRGVLFVDNNVELEKREEFTQLLREDLRQVLGFTALGEGFAEAKYGLVPSPGAPRQDGAISADLASG